jgi:uncharacterized protein (TIGR02246 family)
MAGQERSAMSRSLFAATSAAVVFLLGAAAPAARNAAVDEAAIRDVIAHWDQGWKDFDAELATRDYATDADWTNAFGEPAKGKAGILAYLTKLYQNPGIRSRTSTPSKTTVRFVSPDVAAASSYRETVGQRTASGAEYPTRKTHDLRVLARDHGRWVIVTHLIMDEKEARP